MIVVAAGAVTVAVVVVAGGVVAVAVVSATVFVAVDRVATLVVGLVIVVVIVVFPGQSPGTTANSAGRIKVLLGVGHHVDVQWRMGQRRTSSKD